MAYREVDARQGDADREFAYWTQRGADPDVVNAVLPMLVAADETTRNQGERFLQNYGNVGHGPDSINAAREVTGMALEMLDMALEDGGFVGDPLYEPGTRHVGASAADIEASWDHMHPMGSADYPTEGRENAHRVLLSDAEAALKPTRTFGTVQSVEDMIAEPAWPGE